MEFIWRLFYCVELMVYGRDIIFVCLCLPFQNCILSSTNFRLTPLVVSGFRHGLYIIPDQMTRTYSSQMAMVLPVIVNVVYQFYASM